MCIVIAILNGIEISHKLFTTEIVVAALSIRDCESVLGIAERNTQYRCGLAIQLIGFGFTALFIHYVSKKCHLFNLQ